MTSDDVKKILVINLIVLASQFLLRWINIKRIKRGRQIAVSVLSPVIVLIVVVYAYKHFDAVYFSQMNDFFDGTLIVWNLILLGIFLIYKIVFCLIANAIWSINSVMALTTYKWYHYNDDVNRWFLKTSYTNMRSVANVVAWITAGLSAFILSLDWVVGDKSEWYLKVFPFAAMILATEFYNYLNGYTKQEYERNIHGEEITSRTKGAYYKLRRVYEQLFPAPLLVSHTGNEYLGKEGSSQILADMSKEGDQIQNEVGDYFLHLDRKEGSFDTDLVKMTESLMRGNSAVIFHPFYRDLSDYLLLPLAVTTIRDRKVLVISGRDSSAEDIQSWLNEMFFDYGKTRKLWRSEILDTYAKPCELGILTFSQLYNTRVMRINREFFREVGFILLVEPSRMLATGQIGLNIVTEYISKDSNVTVCALDRDSDGLVDTLSHVFRTDITTVIAPQIPRSVYTVMGWDAKGDYKRQKLFNKETRYLGNGIELAAVAMKNQIPAISWYSSEKAPIEDLKWVAGQYYPAVTKFANLVSQQHSLDDRLTYETNLWGSEAKEESFVIAEDEFCNIFEMLRMFLSRGKSQSFVNVISENYLLRDYMRYNRQLFMTDAKAIPTISPGYSKTERNTIIKLILMMATRPIDEAVIQFEFSLIDVQTDDVYSKLIELIDRYTDITDTFITVRNRQLPGDDLLPERKREYFITPDTFKRFFANSIKNAYYIVEDEEAEREIVDAKLFGHITQLVMPNQIMVHNGKAYRVKNCTPELGCILRRASDSYSSRQYYKQLRHYHFTEKKEVITSRTAYDIGVVFEAWDFRVETTGYLEMQDNGDLRTARVVDLSDDPTIDYYTREYVHKNVLKIVLPDTTEDVRYTFAILISELFRTIFPDTWPYIAVLSEFEEELDGILGKFNYSIDGELDKSAIYIVEDSEIDLGLLEAIDNHFIRILEIIEDYLEWHFVKIKEPPMKDPVLDKIELDENDIRVKETFKSKVLRRFRKFFGMDTSVKEAFEPVTDETDSGSSAKSQAVDLDPKKPVKEKPEKKPGDLGDEDGKDKEPGEESETGLSEGFDMHSDGSEKEEDKEKWKGFTDDSKEPVKEKIDIDVLIDESETIKADEPSDQIVTSDEMMNEVEIVMPILPSRYQNECFLNLGFEEVDKHLEIERVRTYLSARGLSDNSLTRARCRKRFEGNVLNFNTENYCDFCGKPLSGVSYEVLADGRTRCNECSTTAIRDIKDFAEIYHKTEMMMENIFEIRYPVAISVNTADARILAKCSHSVYKPTKQFAARTLGFARFKSGEYSIFIENGCPKLVALNIITHEMTHIWQYISWNPKQMIRIYKQDTPKRDKIAQDLVYEGMAVWASIQILYSMGEVFFAEEQEQEFIQFNGLEKDQMLVRRQDIYGFGYYIYRERYGMEVLGDVPPFSPFKSFPPVDPERVREAVLILDPDEEKK